MSQDLEPPNREEESPTLIKMQSGPTRILIILEGRHKRQDQRMEAPVARGKTVAVELLEAERLPLNKNSLVSLQTIIIDS